MCSTSISSGVFFCCKYGLEILRDRGSIVCVGSLAARVGFHGQSSYAAAKAGVESLVRVLGLECAHRGIRVNAVAPGFINTSMIADASPAFASNSRSLSHSAGWENLAEVAAAVLFLCFAAGQLYHETCPGGRWRLSGLNRVASCRSNRYNSPLSRQLPKPCAGSGIGRIRVGSGGRLPGIIARKTLDRFAAFPLCAVAVFGPVAPERVTEDLDGGECTEKAGETRPRTGSRGGGVAVSR